MKNKKKITLIMLSACILISAYAASLVYIEPIAHIYPKAERIDISDIEKKSVTELTDEDFMTVFSQTGLGEPAVCTLTELNVLEHYQEVYFGEVDYVCEANSIVSREEYVESPSLSLDFIEKGDILITRSSHVFSWRNGHAAIVIDAENRRTLEAVVIGENSCTQSLNKWEHYPNVLVLRLKGAPSELRAEIADEALELLCDKPYRLLSGVFPKKFPDKENITGTQCAHLVWLAFAYYGYDIDSNGGLIVTPKEISESDVLEVVLSYGRG